MTKPSKITKTAVLNGKTYEIERLTLKEVFDVVIAAKKIPQPILGLAGKTNDEIVALIPELVGELGTEFFKIVSTITKIPTEEIEEWGIADLVECVLIVLEVNEYERIIDYTKTIKKKVAQGK